MNLYSQTLDEHADWQALPSAQGCAAAIQIQRCSLDFVVFAKYFQHSPLDTTSMKTCIQASNPCRMVQRAPKKHFDTQLAISIHRPERQIESRSHATFMSVHPDTETESHQQCFVRYCPPGPLDRGAVRATLHYTRLVYYIFLLSDLRPQVLQHNGTNNLVQRPTTSMVPS